MIRPGDEWGTPTTAEADVRVRGDDHALAAVVVGGPTPPLVRFEPVGSELARAVGLADAPPDAGPPLRGIELPIDAISTSEGVAVNAAVFGISPDRLRSYHRRRPITVAVDGKIRFTGPATTVVVANGQFLDGVDVVPRGHPGDGRLEIQVYALTPGERGAMRRRLPRGTHVPHPHITAVTGQSVEISADRPWSVVVDGHATPPTAALRATVIPKAFRLLT